MKPKTDRGPRSDYRPKDPPAVTVALTKLSKQILAAAADRTGLSRSNVVEVLLREHGGRLQGEL